MVGFTSGSDKRQSWSFPGFPGKSAHKSAHISVLTRVPAVAGVRVFAFNPVLQYRKWFGVSKRAALIGGPDCDKAPTHEIFHEPPCVSPRLTDRLYNGADGLVPRVGHW